MTVFLDAGCNITVDGELSTSESEINSYNTKHNPILASPLREDLKYQQETFFILLVLKKFRCDQKI